MTKIGKQREVIEEAFGRLGGMESLVAWANEVDSKGNKLNYGAFVKLYVKLAPPLKVETGKDKDTQEDFIMGLIKAENILKLTQGKPRQIIDVECESQAQ